MVKRLRRRPLTAKTGVRFPMGLPKKKDRCDICPSFFDLSREVTGGRPRGRLSAKAAPDNPAECISLSEGLSSEYALKQADILTARSV